jgi:hypothetical protein
MARQLQTSVRERAEALHLEEEEERKLAAVSKAGPERDRHRMKAERLSDKAWHLEETSDIDFTPNGLWPI